jgi:hypothetical protein
MKSVLCLLSVLVLASCATPTNDPLTSVATSEIGLPQSCACGSYTPRVWSSTISDYWDRTATQMTVIFTATGDENTTNFLAWGIGDGQHVAWVYLVPQTAYADFSAHIARSFLAAQGAALNRTWGIAGGLGTGGPGPIGPGGIPPEYVGRILRTAGSIVDSTDAALAYPR